MCMIAISASRQRLQLSILWTSSRLTAIMRPMMTSSHSSELGPSAHSDLPSLLNIDIDAISKGLASGHFTSVDLVKTYLARIEEASYFKAILQINPDALAAAQGLDDERIRLRSRGYVRCCLSF